MLRAHALLLAVIAGGCYDPKPNPGAPCSDLEPCPSSQMCVAGVCDGPGNGSDIDAPVGAEPDAPITATDRDGDGIEDVADNCADVANTGQGNEDGDVLGDACDPCPIEANDTPSDPDGDLVADGCDPNPGTPGDAIAVFEGFHAGVPATWQVIGNVVANGDDVVLTTPAGNFAALVPPLATIENATITAKLTVDATVGNEDSATTLVMPYDPTEDQGIFCELYAPDAGSQQGHNISLWDSLPGIERDNRGFNWSIATPYRIALKRTNNNYNCSVTPAGQSPQSASGSSNSSPDQEKAAIAVYGAAVRAAYLLIVTSP